MMMDDDVMKESLSLKLAPMMVELFRGNQAIVDQMTFEQLQTFITHFRATQVTLRAPSRQAT